MNQGLNTHRADGGQDCGYQVDQVAGELYQLAALLLGDQDAAVTVVEESLASVQADPCVDEQAALREIRSRVVECALARMEAATPGALHAGPATEQVCCEWKAEEQAPAPVADANSAQPWILASGSEAIVRRPHTLQMRTWLEALAPATRAVFVLRGLLRYDDTRAADLLSRERSGAAYRWTAREVKRTYQDALCALGNLLTAQPQVAQPVGA